MLTALTAVATPEPRTLAHPAFIFGALLPILAAMTVDPAHTQESSRTDPHQQKHFDIQAQPLDHALVEYSLASGVQILADGALTAGKTSPRVSGDYTPAAALEQLLAGAGLRPRFNGGVKGARSNGTGAPGIPAGLTSSRSTHCKA